MKITLFSLTLLHVLLTYVHAECLRKDVDTSVAPSFICQYQVNVTHLSNCTTRVSERIFFPHFCEGSWKRQIKLCSTQQILNDSISVRLKGKPTNFTFSSNNTFIIPSPNSANPVWFRLSYQVRNGVVKHGEGCQANNTSSSESSAKTDGTTLNLIRWTLQDVNKTIDTMSVRFRTKYTNATLFYDSNGTVAPRNGSDITLRSDNVTVGEMNFDVYENGSLTCSANPMDRANQRTLSSGQGRTALVFGITIGAASILMCALAIFCARGSKADYRGDQKADDDDVVVF